jgi:hypothetical protein
MKFEGFQGDETCGEGLHTHPEWSRHGWEGVRQKARGVEASTVLYRVPEEIEIWWALSLDNFRANANF